jgi:nucleotide-binding universal stress UspA family protein
MKGEINMFKKILVPVDGSDSSIEAAKIGANLAAINGGNLTLLYVVRLVQYGFEGIELPEPTVAKPAVEYGNAMLARIREEIESPEAKLVVAVGHPAHTICAKADEGKYDLIIMGSRGMGGLSGSLVGSISQRVSEMVHCPILLCRLPKGMEEEHKIIKSIPNDYAIYY